MLNSTDGYMVGETQTLLRNLAKETNNGTEAATLSVSMLMSVNIIQRERSQMTSSKIRGFQTPSPPSVILRHFCQAPLDDVIFHRPPSGRIRFGVGRFWILVELLVEQICNATSKKGTIFKAFGFCLI